MPTQPAVTDLDDGVGGHRENFFGDTPTKCSRSCSAASWPDRGVGLHSAWLPAVELTYAEVGATAAQDLPVGYRAVERSLVIGAGLRWIEERQYLSAILTRLLGQNRTQITR
jgi:hypothetical protein